MRLIATFAAVATVNATFFEDTNDVLSRSRRVAADDDDQCAEGEVMSQDGFCFDSVEEMLDIMGPLEDDDSLSAKRKFPIGSSAPEDDDSSNDASERTKRRSQRVTLLMSKVASDGNLQDVLNPGKKLRAKEFLKRVNNYGCHCWPNNKGKEHLTGYGQPLDDVDTVCHELKQCHKCVNMDFGDSEKGCDPVDTKYKAKLTKQDDGSIEIQCMNTLNRKGTNNGDCKRGLCECDKAFAEQFSATFGQWDEELWNLDDAYDQVCQRNGRAPERSMSGPQQCCGEFPARRSYNPDNKQCNAGIIEAIGNQ